MVIHVVTLNQDHLYFITYYNNCNYIAYLIQFYGVFRLLLKMYGELSSVGPITISNRINKLTSIIVQSMLIDNWSVLTFCIWSFVIIWLCMKKTHIYVLAYTNSCTYMALCKPRWGCLYMYLLYTNLYLHYIHVLAILSFSLECGKNGKANVM